MLDTISSSATAASAVAPASPDQATRQFVATPPPRTEGAPGGESPSSFEAPEQLPSVGAGRQLQWAKSWTELSAGLRSMGNESAGLRSIQAPEGTLSPEAAASIAAIREVSQFSNRNSLTIAHFSVLSGFITNGSSAVHKLLSQQ